MAAVGRDVEFLTVLRGQHGAGPLQVRGRVRAQVNHNVVNRTFDAGQQLTVG